MPEHERRGWECRGLNSQNEVACDDAKSPDFRTVQTEDDDAEVANLERAIEIVFQMFSSGRLVYRDRQSTKASSAPGSAHRLKALRASVAEPSSAGV